MYSYSVVDEGTPATSKKKFQLLAWACYVKSIQTPGPALETQDASSPLPDDMLCFSHVWSISYKLPEGRCLQVKEGWAFLCLRG